MHEQINHVTCGAPMYIIQDNSSTDDKASSLEELSRVILKTLTKMVLKHFQTHVYPMFVIICRDITRDIYFLSGNCRLRAVEVLSARMN